MCHLRAPRGIADCPPVGIQPSLADLVLLLESVDPGLEPPPFLTPPWRGIAMPGLADTPFRPFLCCLQHIQEVPEVGMPCPDELVQHAMVAFHEKQRTHIIINKGISKCFETVLIVHHTHEKNVLNFHNKITWAVSFLTYTYPYVATLSRLKKIRLIFFDNSFTITFRRV